MFLLYLVHVFSEETKELIEQIINLLRIFILVSSYLLGGMVPLGV